MTVVPYPLELWFPEDRYHFDKVLEYVKRLERQYGIQYYCQIVPGWIVCHVIGNTNMVVPTSKSDTGQKRVRRSLAELLEKL